MARLLVIVFALLSALVTAQSTTNINSACATQPTGSGPTTVPDTDTAFQANIVYSLFATGTGIGVPGINVAGYGLAFSNQQAATFQPNFINSTYLTAYNPATCAGICGAASSPACKAFNIYFERDPTLNPATACPNPISTVNIICALYSGTISAATATNNGQYRNNFHVVIAGSNGYNYAGNIIGL